MKDPEKTAATLAICLMAERRKNPVRAFFQMWPSRSRLEKLANSVLEKEDLPIEPYMTYAVDTIIRNFEDLSRDSMLSTEQEIMDWIRQKGGIPALLLKSMASRIGGAST